MEIVITVGLGMKTVPTMLVPSGSGVSLIEKSVMLKPLSLLRPDGFQSAELIHW
jgi:hypothetical protein